MTNNDKRVARARAVVSLGLAVVGLLVLIGFVASGPAGIARAASDQITAPAASLGAGPGVSPVVEPAGLALPLGRAAEGGSGILAAKRLYVAPAGTDVGNCTDPAAPCGTIQYAVGRASPGDSILVAAGVYTDTDDDGRVVYLDRQVTLEGGYTVSDWTAPNPAAQPTILDGEADAQVIYVVAGANPTIRGLTIRNGSAADSGGGVYILGGDPLLQQNRIYGNTATFNGGGIYVATGSARLEENLIYSNTASLGRGGGIYVADGTAGLYHNTLYANEAWQQGGGVYIASGSPIISTTIIAENIVSLGGTVNGGGVYGANSTVALDYNNVWGNTGGDYGGLVTPGSHSTSTNPIFVAAAAADFRLQADSPCIDWVPVTQTLPLDYNSWPRPFGPRADIGALEFYTGTCFVRVGASQIYTNVQDAVDVAGIGGVVKVAGLCTDDRTDAVVYLNSALTIRGGYTITNWIDPDPDRYPTILDGQQARRVVYISNVAATVEGLHIRNGRAVNYAGGVYVGTAAAVVRDNAIYDNVITGDNVSGAGLYLPGGSPTIEDNDIYGNTAVSAKLMGAGMHIASGNPLITGNRIHDNIKAAAGTTDGGGIYVLGTATIVDNDITFNGASVGAGISVLGGAPIIRNNRILSNTVDSQGGAIMLNGASPVIEQNQIYGNRQTVAGENAGGAGIFVFYGQSPVIRDNAIFDNTTTGDGAAIHLYVWMSGAQIIIERNAIHDNQGGGRGGGLWLRTNQLALVRNNLIYGNSGTLGGGVAVETYATLENNTIYGNQASVIGGGIVGIGSSVPVLRNNIVSSNTNYGIYMYASSVPVTYSDIWNNGVADCGGGATCSGSGNISQNPLLVNPTQGDFHLASGSPCVNTADPSNYPPEDFAAWSRPFGSRADMGAYEFYSGTCFARLSSGGQVYDWPQTAIDVASAGSVVQVAGTCQGTSVKPVGSQTVYIGQALSLQGGYTLTNWLTPTTISTLDAQGGGRVIYIDGSGPVTVDGFVLKGGSATTGGGIYLASSLPATIQNVIVHDNIATNGGGLAITGGSPHLLNATFAYNTATRGGGLHMAAGSPVISNTIVVSNTATSGGGGIYVVAGTPALAYNDFWHNTGGDYSGTAPGSTDLTVDPAFIDPAGRDLHLEVASACIHKGDPATGLGYDLEGDLRPLGRGYDPGADEATRYPDVWLAPDRTAEGIPGTDIAHYHTLTNTGTITDTFYMTYSLSIVGPGSGWTLDYVPVMTLEAGLAVPLAVTIGVPADTLSGSYAVAILTATSAANPEIVDAVTDTTIVNWNPGVELAPEYTEYVNPGAIITYVHTLTNTGNAPDSFELDWDDTLGWTSVSPVQISDLGPHMTATIVVRLVVPPTMPGGVVEQNMINAISTLPGSDASAMVLNTYTVIHKPGDRHVALDGTDAFNNCLLPTLSCRTITYAISQAVAGDTVKIRAGTYQEHDIPLNKDVTLRGGYSADWTVWNPAGTPSIVDAEHLGRVLNIVGNPTVEGLHLVNGQSNGSGGAVYIAAGAPVLRGNWLYDNEAVWRGGAIFNSLGSPTIDGNMIYSNTAGVAGAGLYNDFGSPAVWNNFFYRNTTAGRGGGLGTAQGAPRLWHNTFYQNTADNGGGLYLAGGAPIISNTMVVANSAADGGGIYRAGGSATADYNDVWSNAGGDYAGLAPGVHDLAVDPLFVDAAAFDLHIQMTSPCIDRGDTVPVTLAWDVDGDPRPVGPLPDIGADEYLQTALKLEPDQAGISLPGSTISYTHWLTNNGNYTDTVTLSAASQHAWLAAVPEPIELGPGQGITLEVGLAVPTFVLSGTADTLVVTATSGLNPDVTDTAVDTTTVSLLRSVLLEPPRVGHADSSAVLPVTLVYTHLLTNTTNYADTFSLSGASQLGWQVAVAPSSVALGMGGVAIVQVTVTAPPLPPTQVYADIATIVATSQAEPTVFDTVTDTTILNQQPGVLLEPDITVTGYPAEFIEFHHVVTNTGNYTDSFFLTFIVDYWANLPYGHELTLGPGDSMPVLFIVQVPPDAQCGSQSLAYLKATSDSDRAVEDSATDTIQVGAVYGARLEPPNRRNITSDPTTPLVVHYDHWLTNEGNCPETFDLTTQNTFPGFSATVAPTSVTLGPGQQTAVSVDVTIPAEPPSCDNLMVNTTSVQATGLSSQAVTTDTTVVNQCFGLDIGPDNTEVISEPSLTVVPVEYGHIVTNTGNYIDIVSLTVTSSQGWPVSVLPGRVTVGAGDHTAVNVTLQVPDWAFDVTDTVRVTATSVYSPSEQAAAVDTTIVARPHVSLFPDRSLDTPAGIVVTHTHTLLNDGAITDTYTLSYSDTLGWPTTVTPAIVTDLPPGGETAVTVAIAIPPEITAGTVNTTTVLAQSQLFAMVNDTATDLTRVPRIAGAELEPECSQSADPGTTATCSHTLRNTGNYTETFSLTVHSEIAYAEVHPAIIGPLAPGESFGPVAVDVYVPAYAESGQTEHTEIIITFAESPGQVATVDTTYVNYVNGTRYVAPAGIDAGNNCLDLDYGPCGTTQHATDQALNGDTIKVATGIYNDIHTIDGETQVLYLDKSLIVRGGFPIGDWTTANPAAYPTVLDAAGQGRVVFIPSGSSEPTIEGLHLTGGQADVGGGVYVGRSAAPTLQHNQVYSNTATSGGALYFIGGSNPRLERNIFHHNSAVEGGALYLGSGNTIVWNNSFYANTASSQGGGLYTVFGNPSVRNNTFYGNSAATNGGGGVYVAAGAPTIEHTILAGNINYGLYVAGGSSGAVLSYDDVWGNSGGDCNVSLGTGSFQANPRFVAPAAYDLHLQGASPCIDAGDPATLLPADDLDGNPRPLGLQRDLGAYEYTLARTKLGPSLAQPGTTITYTLLLTNDGVWPQESMVLTDVLDSYLDYAGSLGYSAGSGEYLAASRTISWTGPVYTSTPTIITFTAHITDWLAPGATITNVMWADHARSNVLTTTIAPVAGTRYATPVGDNTLNNCRVPSRPCLTVQYSLDQALSGDTVRLAAGTYTDTLGAGQVASITKSGALIGGHDAATWAYDPVLYLTTLNGQGLAREVLVAGPIAVTVAGLQLEGGTHGVESTGATLVVSRSHVYDHGGDGITAVGGYLAVEATWINDNTGDGIEVSGAPYLLVNDVLARNTNNGLLAANGSGRLLHTTIAENTTAGVAVGGTAAFTNTIVYGHPVGINALAGGAATLHDTLWHANTADTSGSVVHTLDLYADPLFIASATGDYHIRSQSPALDAGLDVGVSMDVDGGRRPLLSGPDIGADEYPLSVEKQAPAQAQPGEMITYHITIEGNDTGLLITDTLHPYVDYGGFVDCSTGTCAYLAGLRAIAWSGDVASPPPVVITFTARITDWLASGVLLPNQVEGRLDTDHFQTPAVYTLIEPRPGTRYVTPGGDDTDNNCLLSARPCATVQHAADQAMGGDEARVAAGTYIPAPGAASVVTITQSLTLIGGFAPDNWTDRDPVANPTVLDAQGASSSVAITGPATVSVIGFDITGAGWRGITADQVDLRLEGNIIHDNAGPGVWIGHSDYVLVNNIIAANTPGLQAYRSTGDLTHTTLADNVSQGAVIDGAAWFTDTIISGHNYGVQGTAGSPIEMANTLWHNNTTNAAGDVVSTTNLYGDPRFVAPSTDYHLRGDSPAIDAGLWAGVGEDVDRDTRPADLAPDLGADQYPLRVARWASPPEPAPCGLVTHTIQLISLARTPLAPVSLYEPLPPGTAYGGSFEYSTGTGSYANGALHWTGSVGPAAPAILTFTATIDPYLPDGTVITHTATVTDPISAYASRPFVLVVRTLDAALAKLSPAQATIGEIVPYSVELTVPGGHQAYQPVLVDRLPSPALSYVAGSAVPPPADISPDGATITWTLSTLSAPCGDPQTVAVSFQARVEDLPGNVRGQILTNTAAVDYTEDVGGRAHHVDTEHGVMLVEPVIALDKQVTPSAGLGIGDLVSVTLAVSNTGDSPLYDGVLTDTLPAGLAFVDGTPGYALNGQTVTWNLATLAPGASTVYTLTAQVQPGVSPGTALVNLAGLAGTSLPGAVAGERSYAAADQAVVYVGYPDLAVDKQRGPAVLSPGMPITYTILYENEGVVPAADVVIVDLLPPHVTYGASASSRPADVTVSEQAITWTLLAPLQPGETGTIWITGTVSLSAQNGEVLENTAIITSTTPELDLQDNTASVTTLVRLPVLAIGKVAEPTPVLPGELLVYTLSVQNTGLGAATELLITDTLPTGTVYQSCSGGDSCGLAGGVVTWQLDLLPGGQTAQLVMTVLVDAGLPYGMQIVNDTYGVTCLQGVTAQGLPLAVGVGAGGNLILAPDRDGNGAPGQAVIYEHTLTNATNVAQTIHLQGSSTHDWSVTVSPDTIYLAAGASAPIVVTVTVDPDAPTGTVDTATIVAAGTITGTATAIDTTAVTGNYVYLPMVMKGY